MFYTGIDQTSRGRIQRIGHAVSSDLISWERTQTTPILEADERWYATAANDPRQEEPFRDPWVFYLEADGLWHMLLTARDNSGSEEAHGTIAHATSADLFSWELQAPLATETGFAQLEVLQVLEVEGRWVVIFCTAPGDVRRTDVPVAYATYSAPADGPLGPFHLDQAEPITAGGGVYAGRIMETPSGQLALMGFIDSGEPGGFQGIIGDPIAVQLSPRGTLVESSIITPVADNHTIAE
jgi:beta-fructofuranosidase